MSMPKMKLLASAVALLGAFAPGVLGNRADGHGAVTETIAPQELGSTTVDGFLIYSFEQCTVIHTTACEVSISTGESLSESATSSEGYDTTSQDAAATSTTDYMPPPASTGGEVEVSSTPGGDEGGPSSTPSGESPSDSVTYVTTGDNGEPSTVTTDHVPSASHHHSSSHDASESATTTSGGDGDGSTATSASATSSDTAGAAVVDLNSGAILGVAALAVALL